MLFRKTGDISLTLEVLADPGPNPLFLLEQRSPKKYLRQAVAPTASLAEANVYSRFMRLMNAAGMPAGQTASQA